MQLKIVLLLCASNMLSVWLMIQKMCAKPISEFQLELISNSFSSSLTLVHDCTEIPSFLETHHWRKFKHMHTFEKMEMVLQSLHNFCKVCTLSQNYAKSCKVLQKVCNKLQKFARVCNALQKFARLCNSLHKFATLCICFSKPLPTLFKRTIVQGILVIRNYYKLQIAVYENKIQ